MNKKYKNKMFNSELFFLTCTIVIMVSIIYGVYYYASNNIENQDVLVYEIESMDGKLYKTHTYYIPEDENYYSFIDEYGNEVHLMTYNVKSIDFID